MTAAKDWGELSVTRIRTHSSGEGRFLDDADGEHAVAVYGGTEAEALANAEFVKAAIEEKLERDRS